MLFQLFILQVRKYWVLSQNEKDPAGIASSSTYTQSIVWACHKVFFAPLAEL